MKADLFSAAAERLALETGLPVSQASLVVRGIDAAPAWYCICGTVLAEPFAVCTGCGK